MWKRPKAITKRNRSLYTGALLTTNENILIRLDRVKRVIIALDCVRKDSARIVTIKNGRRGKNNSFPVICVLPTRWHYFLIHI
jgi:hypothetical protein